MFEIDVDRLLLEYDSDRWDVRPLRFMPKNKQVVLGLVTTAGRTRHQDDLLRRIEEATRYVPLTTWRSVHSAVLHRSAGNLLTWDDQRRKLELIVTPRKVWG